MRKLYAFILLSCFYNFSPAQSLVPNPFTFSSCTFALAPNGYSTCTGSPDCAASRCNVPAGCNGQAVMCFGESFMYQLASPLVIGQDYTITINISTGQLGSSIIGGNHTFNIIGLTSAPGNCGISNYGSACSTPGATLLLSGTVNTIGWQNFTNTFTATSAITYIVIGNCDGTGNGGNLFCDLTLEQSVTLPVELSRFHAEGYDCRVDMDWYVQDEMNAVDHFEVIRAVEGAPSELLSKIPAESGRTDYRYSDDIPYAVGDYQLRVIHRDGTVNLSRVMHVEADCEAPAPTFENNPVRGNEAFLRLNTDGSPTEVSVCSMDGRIVLKETVPAGAAGWQRVRLDVSSLEPGLYFVSTGSGSVTRLQIVR